ncbi:hypothetical protein QF032_006977 [Streptomyces achromogenes]|uniref:Uncharacterized protein n=1 Tax=Streptomyces achromogenes TaxID=67255 RepID=A0ABU0QB97_STRAH|nr:hypothetical protein [Streptomyces achromogenes]MDQ0687938.1 hypothetical protein [Streptomyces achromogenes]MDQ0835133.1 hypothetical protein [Streptomyces achromogenes]
MLRARPGASAVASEDGFRTALLVGGGLALVSAAIAAAIPAARAATVGEDVADRAAEPEQARI